jgi:hypothetical protein
LALLQSNLIRLGSLFNRRDLVQGESQVITLKYLFHYHFNCKALIYASLQPVHERPINPDPIAAEKTPPASAPALRGYPQLARFLSSDKSFFIFRRFDELAARNLLYMQDELSSLGEKLSALDRAELMRRNPGDLYNLHSNRRDKNQQRKKLMKEIREVLKEYRKWIYLLMANLLKCRLKSLMNGMERLVQLFLLLVLVPFKFEP